MSDRIEYANVAEEIHHCLASRTPNVPLDLRDLLLRAADAAELDHEIALAHEHDARRALARAERAEEALRLLWDYYLLPLPDDVKARVNELMGQLALASGVGEAGEEA